MLLCVGEGESGCVEGDGYSAAAEVLLQRSRSVLLSSFDASTKIHFRSPVRPSPDPVRPPDSGSSWTSPAASNRSLPILHALDGDGIEHHPGSVLRTTPFMRPRVALIEGSVP